MWQPRDIKGGCAGFSLRKSRLLKSAFRVGILLASVLVWGSLAAAGLDSAGARLIGERPIVNGEMSGSPTMIDVRIHLIDIDKIDDVNKRFTADIFINVAWQDPRLAIPADQRSGQIRTLPLDQIWTPRGLIVNARGLSAQLPDVATVDDTGNVEMRQRLSGELSADLHLEEFPFDSQRLPIDIVSYQYPPDELRFSSDAEVTGDAESFSAEGWSFRILEPKLGEFLVPAAGVVRPRLTYFIEAVRNARYYLLTMFVPMSLIVFMSWTVFWLQPDIVPARIAVSTASIFSLIAFGFSIRLSLPRVSYMTRADAFVMGCTLLVFLALGVAVIGSRWASSGRMERALRLNAVARWVYVGLFAIVATIALTI